MIWSKFLCQREPTWGYLARCPISSWKLSVMGMPPPLWGGCSSVPVLLAPGCLLASWEGVHVGDPEENCCEESHFGRAFFVGLPSFVNEGMIVGLAWYTASAMSQADLEDKILSLIKSQGDWCLRRGLSHCPPAALFPDWDNGTGPGCQALLWQPLGSP